MARGVIKLAALAGLAKQARDYARNNPDSVSSAIAKVESMVSSRIAPKYAAQVGKGGNAVRSGLGIAPASATPEASSPRTEDTAPHTPTPTPTTPSV